MREQKRADFFFCTVIKSHKTKHYKVLLQLLELPFPAGQPARTTEKKLGSENEAIFLTTRCFSAALSMATPATLAALSLHLRH
jgi:hypothetical protein